MGSTSYKDGTQYYNLKGDRMNTNDPKPSQGSDPKKEEKVSDKIHNIGDSRKVDEIYHYAKQNKEQTITYILLVLGLLILFFNNLIGGFIIGMVAGYYFAPEIVYYVRNIKQIFSGPDQLRYIVLSGLLLAFLIAAPGVFIGAVIVAALKQLLGERKEG